MREQPVTLTIDGKEVTVPKGTLIIRAAEQLGIEIPRFCDHPYLAPAGACRQCYVQIEGQPKLATSCTVPVAPGMVVRPRTRATTAARGAGREPRVPAAQPPARLPDLRPGRGVPAAGPGARLRARRESRFTRGEARLPEARARCRRWSTSTASGASCARGARGSATRSAATGSWSCSRAAPASGSRSRPARTSARPFSGNTVQICPVGALTATPYRFVARPFDLTSGD